MAVQTGGEGDQRGHEPTREFSEVARRDPVDRHQMRGEGHDMTDSAGSGPSDRSASGVIPTVPEAFDRLAMSLLEAIMTQRAVRRVLPDPVDDAIVLKCIELGLRAPTGSNSQNWEFVVVKDQKVKEQLAARYRESWSMYGSLGRRAAGGDESMLKILRAVQWQIDHFAEIPVLVVPCLRAGVRAGHVPYLPSPHWAASSFFGDGRDRRSSPVLAACPVRFRRMVHRGPARDLRLPTSRGRPFPGRHDVEPRTLTCEPDPPCPGDGRGSAKDPLEKTIGRAARTVSDHRLSFPSRFRLRDVPPDRHSAMTGFPRPLGALMSLP